ncbi:hypothetical protein SBOR_2584 [Sclerotinia borealis F-4128]|uniref:Uncharacterized protein n=1 Tax=Sclerotinia borealis (strain F-4128) TaxID=1432307 RepID=W9CR07_SCLBF|nr:hypothetical protein SBOR_2584 [Sclerotinia borealis F-4128]
MEESAQSRRQATIQRIALFFSNSQCVDLTKFMKEWFNVNQMYHRDLFVIQKQTELCDKFKTKEARFLRRNDHMKQLLGRYKSQRKECTEEARADFETHLIDHAKFDSDHDDVVGVAKTADELIFGASQKDWLLEAYQYFCLRVEQGIITIRERLVEYKTKLVELVEEHAKIVPSWRSMESHYRCIGELKEKQGKFTLPYAKWTEEKWRQAYDRKWRDEEAQAEAFEMLELLGKAPKTKDVATQTEHFDIMMWVGL